MQYSHKAKNQDLNKHWLRFNRASCLIYFFIFIFWYCWFVVKILWALFCFLARIALYCTGRVFNYTIYFFFCILLKKNHTISFILKPTEVNNWHSECAFSFTWFTYLQWLLGIIPFPQLDQWTWNDDFRFPGRGAIWMPQSHMKETEVQMYYQIKKKKNLSSYSFVRFNHFLLSSTTILCA